MDWRCFPAIELVEYNGKLYSLSNRRLFMLRVLANLGSLEQIVACIHPRGSDPVQRLWWDASLGAMATKWDRAYSTKNDGATVEVHSKSKKISIKVPLNKGICCRPQKPCSLPYSVNSTQEAHHKGTQ